MSALFRARRGEEVKSAAVILCPADRPVTTEITCCVKPLRARIPHGCGSVANLLGTSWLAALAVSGSDSELKLLHLEIKTESVGVRFNDEEMKVTDDEGVTFHLHNDAFRDSRNNRNSFPLRANPKNKLCSP